MRTLLKTLFFFLLAAQICFGQWYPQNSGTTQHLNKVQFVDANTGWAVGDSGLILHTSNGGVDWVQQASGTNIKLVDISFVDANTGWVLASDWDPNVESILFKTTNGGINWIQQINDTSWFLNNMFFNNQSRGWIIGHRDWYPDQEIIVLKTTNSGAEWQYKSSSKLDSLVNGIFCNEFDIDFIDSLKGFVAGGCVGCAPTCGIVVITTDGGESWNGVWSGFISWREILFLDQQNGIIVGTKGNRFQRGTIYRTSDSGMTWIPNYEQQQASEFKSVTSMNQVYFWVSGVVDFTQGIILRSSDSGNTWTEQLFEIDGGLNSIYFFNENIGWAVGDNGTVLHTTNGGVTFIDNEPTQPTEFALLQNYPNPFNPSTKISWQSPVSNHQTLKVYDVLGNEIATLVDEYKAAGRYEVEFNIYSGEGRNLSSGIYFYQLKAGEYTAVKKMILLR